MISTMPDSLQAARHCIFTKIYSRNAAFCKNALKTFALLIVLRQEICYNKSTALGR